MRVVAHFRPKVFLMENVPQLLASDEYIEIKKIANELGYTVRERVLHAVDYGAPQKRKRAIIIGSRIGTPEHPEYELIPIPPVQLKPLFLDENCGSQPILLIQES